MLNYQRVKSSLNPYTLPEVWQETIGRMSRALRQMFGLSLFANGKKIDSVNLGLFKHLQTLTVLNTWFTYVDVDMETAVFNMKQLQVLWTMACLGQA
jgi:hypothetical protein